MYLGVFCVLQHIINKHDKEDQQKDRSFVYPTHDWYRFRLLSTNNDFLWPTRQVRLVSGLFVDIGRVQLVDKMIMSDFIKGFAKVHQHSVTQLFVLNSLQYIRGVLSKLSCLWINEELHSAF